MLTTYADEATEGDQVEIEQSKTREREQVAQTVFVHAEDYAKERIYVRQVSSSRYSIAKERQQRLASIPRVFTPSGVAGWGAANIIAPGDDIFRTQSLHVHFVVVPPNGRNDGHGHQNEAFFYALDGHGYELHDGKRYDWKAGDAIAVHNDCVHWHNNPDPEKTATCIVFKPKPLALFLGLTYQGKIGTTPANDDLWEPRSEWLTGRPEGDELVPKVLTPKDTPWELTPFGRVRQLAGEGVPLRIKATDVYLHDIPGGSRSGRRWQMADEVSYVIDGEGYDLHWDVEAEITDEYHARIAKEPTRWEWKEGDVVWTPQNTVVQRFATGASPATLISGSNRLFKNLGYSRIVHLENAPEYDAAATQGGHGH